MERISRELLIQNEKGLHARASSKFAVTAGGFKDSDIRVSKDDSEVSAYSIMDLMMLAAAKGSTILVSAEGEQAGDALDALENLVNSLFGEDA